MLNQLLRFTLVSSLLLWLKPRWKSLLVLAVAVVMVHVFHSEYLDYVQLSGNDTFLVWSYVIKWLLLLGVAGTYLSFLMFGGKQRRSGQGLVRTKASPDNKAPDSVKADGFDFLRDKKRLETRAEKVIAAKDKAT